MLKKQLFTVTSKINEHKDSLSSVKSNKRNITVTSDLRLAKVLEILKHGVISKRQGGAYISNNSKLLKEEVIKAIAILENLTN